MTFRVLLLSSISMIAVSASAFAASPVCKDDRYACEPQIAAETVEPLALQPATAQSIPRKVRPVAERRARQARTARKNLRHAPHSVELEKAPPDAPREMEKAPPENVLPAGTLSWAPLETPWKGAAPFDALDAARSNVRVVNADQVNEVDLAAPQEPVKVVPVRVDTAQLKIQQEVAAETPAAPVDTALLERVLITFGGAFGAASAMRLFLDRA